MESSLGPTNEDEEGEDTVVFLKSLGKKYEKTNLVMRRQKNAALKEEIKYFIGEMGTMIEQVSNSRSWSHYE